VISIKQTQHAKDKSVKNNGKEHDHYAHKSFSRTHAFGGPVSILEIEEGSYL
jgi:hypothetical protein